MHPKKLDIPPHEYRYVTVYFAPKAIKGFAAMFEAQVENGSNPKTRRYTCLLRGEGTLPTLTLEQPTEFNADGQPFIKFPRILRAKKNTSTILLKNNGIIPATGRIDFSQHQAFKVEGGSRVFTLEPHKAESFTVVFNPREVGEFSHAVGLKVQQNPFENYQVALTGESYMEDIVYERLPGDHEDQLHFPDGPLGSSRTVTFTLRNLSDKHYHFEWPEGLEGVAVSPAVGHLHAKQTKEILVTFQSDSPLTYSSQDFSVKVSPITYPGEPQDWDDRMTMVQYPDDPAVAPSSRGGSAGSGGGRKGSGKGKTKEKGGKKGEKKPETPPQPTDGPITVVAPEPECTHDSAATKALPLTLFAVADMAKPECDRTPINFRPTMMFQTRAFTFPLQNTSTAQMDFKMRIATLDGETDVGSIYEVNLPYPAAAFLKKESPPCLLQCCNSQEYGNLRATMSLFVMISDPGFRVVCPLHRLSLKEGLWRPAGVLISLCGSRLWRLSMPGACSWQISPTLKRASSLSHGSSMGASSAHGATLRCRTATT